MKVAPPALGRPMDWAYASNRFIVIVTPIIGSVAGLAALVRGEPFSDAVGWLAHELQMKSGGVIPANTQNDGGADVIAWKPFADDKPGYPVVF